MNAVFLERLASDKFSEIERIIREHGILSMDSKIHLDPSGDRSVMRFHFGSDSRMIWQNLKTSGEYTAVVHLFQDDGYGISVGFNANIAEWRASHESIAHTDRPIQVLAERFPIELTEPQAFELVSCMAAYHFRRYVMFLAAAKP